MAEQSLKDKTVRGVGWSAVDNIAQYAVSFVVSIVLARLLTPDDYGLIGIIAIFTAVCNTLINAGFTQALIRKNDTTDDDYNTVFIINLFMSLLLYVVIYVCAPLIASFFHREELVLLTRISSLSMIIGALSLVPQTRLTKLLDFKSQTIVTIISSIASGVIGIVLALLNYGVWALVAQQISSQFCKTILLWFYNKWKPLLVFSRNSFHDMFGFGWKLVVSGLLDTIWKELNQVVIGRFYSSAALGQYTRANQFSSLFSSNLTGVIQRVSFPVLSNIQNDKTRMLSAYRKMIKTTMFITIICMFFLGAISEPLIYCLIGSKWHDASIYLTLLCIAGSTYPLHAMNLNMLQVQGRSDLFLGLEIVKKIIAVGPLLIGVFVGILPMLYANVVFSVICFFLNSFYSGRLVGYSSWMQLKDISPSLGLALLISVPIYFMKYLPFSYWFILPIQVVMGGLLFFGVCEHSKMEEYVDVKTIVLQFLEKIRINKH